MHSRPVTSRELPALWLPPTHLNHDIAVRLKMLPDVDASVLHAVGNAALDGATIFAQDPEGTRTRLADIRRRTKHVELAMRDDFQELFIESLGF